eukprot:12262853-Alexandrium_andersonii.AAC.1
MRLGLAALHKGLALGVSLAPGLVLLPVGVPDVAPDLGLGAEHVRGPGLTLLGPVVLEGIVLAGPVEVLQAALGLGRLAALGLGHL